jgi:hypothetical protein
MMPVAWAVGILIFVYLQRILAPRDRIVLTLSILGAIVALRPLLTTRVTAVFEPVSWAVGLMRMTGADQAWVYERRYIVVAGGLLFLWLLSFHLAVGRRRLSRLILGMPFQLWILHAIGILLVPNALLPDGYVAAFEFIPERLSLFAALVLCGAFSAVKPGRLLVASSMVVAALFFSLLYSDGVNLNRLEDQAEGLLAGLPANQRVIGPLCSGDSRINGSLHIVDRACLGKCYSFANYEPASSHFRLRATPQNGVVLDQRADVSDVESGRYVARAEHLPMYLLGVSEGGNNLFVKSLRAGDAVTCAAPSPE